ncbi:heat-shock protein Hsp20 [Alkalilimnicola ehrlichii]|uniref:Heat-shock protein Hsp20 n=1 Tax=Alkalilimnicola ehrlichii TaxID=351052 RepID=A0A3E0X0Z5_9GAMM|nr:Hsp20/alpha crystallin family protein [Alkalilimnicola ehrlichii]RFA30514.1 heat-shock protein Hsp20 [Alkalilimnicola ehrlichii]RFA38063.1 heat-shock protein Hsp20 [Alkalilimnicola ehrlichii]
MSSRDPRIWMWTEACEILERAERMQRSLFQLGPAPSAAWEPPVDVYETDAQVVIVMALPGVAAEHIEIVIDAGTLVVVGARSLPKSLRHAAIHRLEIPFGRFERRIELPRGRYVLEDQQLADGCLVLSLRKV